MDNVILCPNLTSCFSQPAKANFTDLSGVLRLLEQVDHGLEEANKTTLALDKIELMRKKVKEVQILAEEVNNPERIIQKVRKCGDEESTIRVVTLSSLVSLLVLAALATYQLHKITDYKVGFV